MLDQQSTVSHLKWCTSSVLQLHAIFSNKHFPFFFVFASSSSFRHFHLVLLVYLHTRRPIPYLIMMYNPPPPSPSPSPSLHVIRLDSTNDYCFTGGFVVWCPTPPLCTDTVVYVWETQAPCHRIVSLLIVLFVNENLAKEIIKHWFPFVHLFRSLKIYLVVAAVRYRFVSHHFVLILIHELILYERWTRKTRYNKNGIKSSVSQ